MHSAIPDGRCINGDGFSVIFAFDATDKATGKHVQLKEVALCTVGGAGNIAREEF